MQKIKTFINSFVKSLSSTSYYKDILNANPSFSLKYFFVLMGLITIVTSGVNAGLQVPKLRGFIQDTTNDLVNKYPGDLIVKIENGTLTTNQTEPLIVPMDADVKQDPNLNFTNLLVLDQNGTVEDIKKYDTMILINGKNILVQDATDKLQTHPISNFGNMEVTKDGLKVKAENFLASINRSIVLFPLVFVGFMFVFTIYYFVAKPVYMLFCAGVIYIFMKMNKSKEPFVRAIQISAHTITLVIVLEAVTLILGIGKDLSAISFTIHMVFAYIVVASLDLGNRIQNN